MQGYRAVIGQPFPLVQFGNHAVAMRLEDRNWLKPDEFPAEIPCLLDRKLLVTRFVRGPDGSDVQRIQFRHDRVWDFFIAFGIVRQEAPERVDVENTLGVYLSPQQAKALWNVLGQNITQYEQAFGPLVLEPV